MSLLYFYGIIQKPEEFNIKSKGLNNQKIFTVPYKNIAAVVSEINSDKLEVDQENLYTHDQVVSEIFETYETVLPTSFGTIAQNKSALVERILKPEYQDFIKDLKKLSGKIEIDLKAIWTSMEDIYEEILYEDPELMETQKILERRDLTFEEKVAIGKKIANSLNKKKEFIKNTIVDFCNKFSEEIKESPIRNEDMIFNLSFLLPKEKSQKFNTALETLGKKLKNECIYLKKIGPIAPFNFFNLKISI